MDEQIQEPTKVKQCTRRTAACKYGKQEKRSPSSYGDELDQQVKLYITVLCNNGAVVNSAIVTACAEGLVKSQDANLLQDNGGHLAFGESLAQTFYSTWVLSSVELQKNPKFLSQILII